ncbi:MAG: hypothetical protein JW910_18655 [Anaerolineae bacterium]|nr:hypothetical protein [Anaerolineae bacterium]
MGVPIHGTFDAALARNLLRKKAAEQNWRPNLRARATAALTALTEIVVLSQTPAMLDINVINRGGNTGIELVCEVRWVAAKQVWLDQANAWLARTTDELHITDGTDSARIAAIIWSD